MKRLGNKQVLSLMVKVMIGWDGMCCCQKMVNLLPLVYMVMMDSLDAHTFIVWYQSYHHQRSLLLTFYRNHECLHGIVFVGTCLLNSENDICRLGMIIYYVNPKINKQQSTDQLKLKFAVPQSHQSTQQQCLVLI